MEQLFIALEGKIDDELGLRFVELEVKMSEGYLIKEFKPLPTNSKGLNLILFLLEKPQ